MIDAGATLMGTGGDYISTSGLTVDQIWAQAVSWDDQGYIMTAGCINGTNGIISNHAYTFISEYEITNGL